MHSCRGTPLPWARTRQPGDWWRQLLISVLSMGLLSMTNEATVAGKMSLAMVGSRCTCSILRVTTTLSNALHTSILTESCRNMQNNCQTVALDYAQVHHVTLLSCHGISPNSAEDRRALPVRTRPPRLHVTLIADGGRARNSRRLASAGDDLPRMRSKATVADRAMRSVR